MDETEISEESFWAEAHKQMLLDPTITNLNTGSWGPLPRCVFEHVTDLRRKMAEEPMNFFVRHTPDLLWDARVRMAAFLNGNPKRLIFTANVSSAINIVASGSTLSGPGEILLS